MMEKDAVGSISEGPSQRHHFADDNALCRGNKQHEKYDQSPQQRVSQQTVHYQRDLFPDRRRVSKSLSGMFNLHDLMKEHADLNITPNSPWFDYILSRRGAENAGGTVSIPP